MIKFLLAFVSLFIVVAACSDDDSGPSTPTATTSAAATATTRPSGTATTGPQTTPTALPPVDGTIAAEGFGGTEPVTIKSNPDPITNQAVLRDVRVGAHPEQGGWDRIVFEFADSLPNGEVHYAQTASQCGSGMPVQMPGAALLLVEFEPAAAHNEAGQLTIPSITVQGPGNIILESRQICDFEAHVDWAIGLKSQQRFKVTRLSNPTRLVIDVKQ